MPECPVCKKEYKRLTASHVQSKGHQANLKRAGILPEDDPTFVLLGESTPKATSIAADAARDEESVSGEVGAADTPVEQAQGGDDKLGPAETIVHQVAGGHEGDRPARKTSPVDRMPVSGDADVAQVDEDIMGESGVEDALSRSGTVEVPAVLPGEAMEKRELTDSTAKQARVIDGGSMHDEVVTTSKQASKLKHTSRKFRFWSRSESNADHIIQLADRVRNSWFFKLLGFNQAEPGSVSLFVKEMLSANTLKAILYGIFSVAIGIGFGFILGQLTFPFLQSNASNAGHVYGIITSGIAFFIFARYLRDRNSTLFVRIFIFSYFIIYSLMVAVILLFLVGNVSYFYSTLGNACTLFSLYMLIIFLLNPEVLGIHGNIRNLFKSGQHVRIVFVYISIALLEIVGFSLLDYAIHFYSGGTAFSIGNEYTFWDFVYFSVITFTTIGYGDISALSPIARFSVMVQAILSHVISLLFLAILLLYLGSAIDTD